MTKHKKNLCKFERWKNDEILNVADKLCDNFCIQFYPHFCRPPLLSVTFCSYEKSHSFLVKTQSYILASLSISYRVTPCVCSFRMSIYAGLWNANYIYTKTKNEEKVWQMVRIHISVYGEKWDQRTKREGSVAKTKVSDEKLK